MRYGYQPSPCGRCIEDQCADHPRKPVGPPGGPVPDYEVLSRTRCAKYLDWQALALSRSLAREPARSARRTEMQAALREVRARRRALGAGAVVTPGISWTRGKGGSARATVGAFDLSVLLVANDPRRSYWWGVYHAGDLVCSCDDDGVAQATSGNDGRRLAAAAMRSWERGRQG